MASSQPHGGAYAAFPDSPAAFSDTGRDATLQRLFQSAVKHAEDRIDDFDRRAMGVKRSAAGNRWLALFLFVLGTIAPVAASLLQKLSAAYPKSTFVSGVASLPLTEIGYVLLAVAGGLVIFDRFFDRSGSWIRFRQTQARLEVLLADFRFQWIQLLSEGGGSIPADSFTGKGLGARCTASMRAFVNTVEIAAEAETGEWANKFLASIDAFDQQLKSFQSKASADAATQSPASQPAPISQPQESRGDAETSEPKREIAVTVRIFVPAAASLDPGTLSLTADDAEVAIDPDGYAELNLAVGVSHKLVAQATRAGQPARGNLTLTPTINQEGAVFVIQVP